MKRKVAFFKIALMLGVSVLLYSFSNVSYKANTLKGTHIEIYPIDQPFIDYQSVNNLLIQNPDDLSSIRIDAIDLVKLEQKLIKHQMIKKASVYLTIDGNLSAKIHQRKPMARLVTDTAFCYIDAAGKIMPSSDHYSARVPLAYGFNTKNAHQYQSLFKKIYNDEFYRKFITQITLKSHSGIVLETRLDNFAARIGSPEHLAKKLANLKAFYYYLKKNDQLDQYKMVDLRFGKQVIASKN
ncbi:MAG: cell division protein FtsQ/DivIB [Psychroflexus sp.]|nr:cell division protein FtsQ/DivIB [Psychroflexus sp.]